MTSTRERVSTTLRDWGVTDAAAVQDVLLVATELVGNAIRYGGSSVRFQLDRRADGVLVSVSDSSAQLPQSRQADDFDETGRGLQIVTALSTRWGVEPLVNGKRVWAFLRLLR